MNSNLPFLDMLIQNNNGKLTSTWYTKTTDTGLTMNFHSLAPDRYKRSVVSGMVHRILQACSTWKAVHESLEKAKKILTNNQYPPSFFDPIIKKCHKISIIFRLALHYGSQIVFHFCSIMAGFYTLVSNNRMIAKSKPAPRTTSL